MRGSEWSWGVSGALLILVLTLLGVVVWLTTVIVRTQERARVTGILITAANSRRDKGDAHTAGVLTGLLSQVQAEH